ncbi:hypothetical protein RRG08_010521 [Elysia crispata]|uniref:Uncharacterized protein n=1 Tax=Elysia crispata TaxID=231223 RepID=A0AAE1APW6_9GAST|nr:hypothetical protein RRG08_010521 [Elysia crispata]
MSFDIFLAVPHSRLSMDVQIALKLLIIIYKLQIALGFVHRIDPYVHGNTSLSSNTALYSVVHSFRQNGKWQAVNMPLVLAEWLLGQNKSSTPTTVIGCAILHMQNREHAQLSEKDTTLETGKS